MTQAKNGTHPCILEKFKKKTEDTEIVIVTESDKQRLIQQITANSLSKLLDPLVFAFVIIAAQVKALNLQHVFLPNCS